MKALSFLFLVCALLFIGEAHASGKESGHGGTIVPVNVEGESPSCFNQREQRVSIYLLRAIMAKDNDFFTKDRAVVITAKLEIHTRLDDTGEESTLNVSRSYKFDVTRSEEGIVEIPLRKLPIIESYALSGKATTDSTKTYKVTSIVMNLFLSTEKEKSGFSKTLETIIAASKKLPIPANPYTDGFVKYGESFNQIIDTALQEGADTAPLASFGVVFTTNGVFSENDLTDNPGYFAVVFDEAKPKEKKDGVFYKGDLSKLKLETLTYREHKGLVCKDTNGKERTVRNNYLVLAVTSSKK